jgi:tetratricopeptide (TPR) repeat protein
MVKSRYPASPQSATVDLALDRLTLTEALDNNDLDIGEIISKFIDDHNSLPNLSGELAKVIEHYNILNGLTWTKERNIFLNKKLIILEKIIEKVPDSYSKINFYKMSADLLKTRDTLKAIEYCQKILGTWPEYDEKGEILWSLGSCYNTLMAKKIIDRESIEPLMRETYEKVVRDYPYTYFGRLSKYRLEVDERIKTGKVGPAQDGGK